MVVLVQIRRLGIWATVSFLFVSCSIRKNPQIRLGAYYFVGKADESLAVAENGKLLEMSRHLLEAVIQKKTDVLVSMIDPVQGAIIDAKIMVSYEKVKAALNDEMHPLHKTLWNEKAMQETDSTGELHCYQKYFQSVDEIEVLLFYYSHSEAEVRLNFKNRPSVGVMGNLIFQKRQDRWILLNFF